MQFGRHRRRPALNAATRRAIGSCGAPPALRLKSGEPAPPFVGAPWVHPASACRVTRPLTRTPEARPIGLSGGPRGCGNGGLGNESLDGAEGSGLRLVAGLGLDLLDPALDALGGLCRYLLAVSGAVPTFARRRPGPGQPTCPAPGPVPRRGRGRTAPRAAPAPRAAATAGHGALEIFAGAFCCGYVPSRLGSFRLGAPAGGPVGRRQGPARSRPTNASALRDRGEARPLRRGNAGGTTMNLVLLIVVLLLVFGGGGGYYWSRRP